jgi:tetratricopeptide (TPR) repeat protein
LGQADGQEPEQGHRILRTGDSERPKYALAYAGLADCNQLLAEYLATSPQEGFTKAREAAKKALEIDDQLAEAHTSLAYTLAFYDWNWAASEREFKRAIELDPNYPTAHQWYAEYLTAVGRFDEAKAEHEKALQLNPTSLIIQIDLASLYFTVRNFDEAIIWSQKVIDADPDFAYGYVFLSFSLGQKGMKQEQAEAYIRSVELFGEPDEANELRAVLAKDGIKAMWLKRIEQVDPAKQESFSALWRALLYNWAGDKQNALDWLDKAYERRDRWVVNCKYSPEMDPLRTEPRFQDLIRRIGL